MRTAPLAVAAILAAGAVACGDDEAPAATATGGSGGGEVASCRPDQISLDAEGCLDVGVVACPEGFTRIDNGGCAPPAWSDPVMDCGTAPWGDIPVGPSTVYVDAAHVGPSDGSSAQPFTTLGAAMAVAPDGAIVAIAAGSYPEAAIYPLDRRLSLWGRCPALVEVLGDGDPRYASVEMASTPAGPELHGVTVRGAGFGIALSQALDALVDRVVVSGTAAVAVSVDNALGPASLTIVDSIIEGVTEVGLLAGGSEVTMIRSVIRDVVPAPTGLGAGLSAISRQGSASSVALRDSLLEGLHGVGAGAVLSSLSIERSVVRDVQALGTNGEDGTGIAIQGAPGAGHALTLSESYLAHTHEVGVIAIDAQLTVSDTTIRDVKPQPQGNLGGSGISVQLSPGAGIDPARIERVSIAGASGFGIVVSDAPVAIASTWVADTSPLAFEALFGDGAVVVSLAQRASVIVDGSRFERSDRAGLSSFSSDVRVSRSMFACNQIHLDGEDTALGPFSFEDAGDNHCGCDGAEVVCKITTANLALPSPP